MNKRRNINALITRLAASESAFMRTRFLAPVAAAGSVHVRIAGVVCRMRVQPANYSGWGVFQPMSFTCAKLERPATMFERRQYLQLFPAVRLILTHRLGSTWRAAPARLHDRRFGIEGDAIVNAVDDAELLDTIVARFDSAHFWFDEADPDGDPALAAYLRESIVRMVDPPLLTRSGLTPEQRIAYGAIHAQRVREALESAHASGEHRLRLAIGHAGAQLSGFAELHDGYRVTYTVDGQRHVSVVRKNDLSIQSAGICLSGQDTLFDLASLVGVLREGHRAGGIRHGLQV